MITPLPGPHFGSRHAWFVAWDGVGAHSRVVARLNSLQVWATELAASPRFYGQFLGVELDAEPHQHGGNEALHYDVA